MIRNDEDERITLPSSNSDTADYWFFRRISSWQLSAPEQSKGKQQKDMNNKEKNQIMQNRQGQDNTWDAKSREMVVALLQCVAGV